ncbi:HYC_CC_PP family protein [Flagellimonas pacifica]|uniref:Secreted protein n=1 Tax=Flagellimonas pacifica TaxID=1247520 RepID=A0A285MVY6_9FLAO|nr:hypothetical protein [Allomuricauda parva]SNZ01360.1 hypothetical protein SAMN06265377_3198 [Allomuricauda parva]
MKVFFHKIVSYILTFAVLFATSSFSADMHFCCDKLVDMAVFGKAKPCDEKVKKTERPSKECSLGQKDCCNNVKFSKTGVDDIKKVTSELTSENYIFLHTFFYTYINGFEGLEKNVVPFLHYDPPLISKDIQVLHETFLI